jgi:hypothetical protein
VELFLLVGVGSAILLAAGLAVRAVWDEVREILVRSHQPAARLEALLPLRGRWLSLLLNGPRLAAWGLTVFLGVLGALFVFALGTWALLSTLCGVELSPFR